MDSRNVGKKRKKCHGQTLPEDFISALPEGILHHILSFLDIKEVVQTCFISRRWRYVWKSVQDLNFDYSLWAQRPQTGKKKRPFLKKVIRKDECMDFVDRVLFVFRDATSRIRKIQLSHHYLHDNGRLVTWLLYLLPNVKEVYLETPDKLLFILPHSLFTSKIETFYLRSNVIRRVCKVPESTVQYNSPLQ